MNNIVKAGILLLLAGFLNACSSGMSEHHHPEAEGLETASEKNQKEITVSLITSKGEAAGKAIITETIKGVNIHLEGENLPPGKRAIHIHETGSCVKPDFTSAGAHLNPFAKKHGFENPHGPHAGDIPNITIGSDGKITADVTAPLAEFSQVLDEDGSALVIHEKEDDYKTDPAGNAGARIACGVIHKENQSM
ncbi:superoxide dismutase family protein [Metabacillus sp. KIGAM252]|uniref:Superoxide dismutase [Cu-Zn] n=1 Tax=Metabacillus flavus TaxID=2823519 RepID=A0ABS5LFS9_9BACI|nr:superoxide dismutase family protein [Metabacillus flavus]MBS2969244.1 superoxide dismutase family protein [Metabacillus flavus]